MRYEIIREIKNACSGNQMRDVFFTCEEIADPDAWIRAREPRADEIERETLRDGLRYHVTTAGLVTEYSLTEDD